ncbi:MAG: hypothetical protein WBN22_08985 [Verrucomicrobiia bacterium]
MRITNLSKERWHVIEEPIVRIYLQLSAPPPLGWSYLFSCVWRAVAYPLKRRVGLEGDMIWMEGALEEMGQHHLEELEKAVSLTNANYRFFVQQRAAAEQRRRELNGRTQAQLNELCDGFNHSADSTVASGETLGINDVVATRSNPSGSFIGLLRLLFGIRRKNGGGMVSHGA